MCRHPAHKLSGVTLSVSMLESQPDVDVCAVQVSGLQRNHSRDFISLYFESNKRSGGGPIDDLVVDDDKGTAVITFASSSSTNLFCYIYSFLCFIFLEFIFAKLCRSKAAIVAPWLRLWTFTQRTWVRL